MKQITLICVAGMSTSMMVSRMKAAADSRNLDVQIQAMSESSFDTGGKQTDVLLPSACIKRRLRHRDRKSVV